MRRWHFARIGRSDVDALRPFHDRLGESGGLPLAERALPGR
jgi:hypothetical protein